jgi:hypothetical protein
VPQYLCEATRNEELPAQFVEDRGVAVLLKQGSRRLTPLFIGSPDQLKEHHVEIVTVPLRRADLKVVARVEINQNSSVGHPVIQNVVQMQITVRPCRLVPAAPNLVHSPQFAGGGGERVDARFVAMEQLPQTDTGHFRNDHGRAGTDLHGWPLWVQQAGTMNLPIHPLVGSDQHAASAPRQRQEAIPEPNDDTTADSAPFDDDWETVSHALLHLIHANMSHQPGNASLQHFHHRRAPSVVATSRTCRDNKKLMAVVAETERPPPGCQPPNR